MADSGRVKERRNVTTPSLRTKAVIAIAASLIGILLGATVFVPGAASAQETTTTTETEDRPILENRIRNALEALVSEGTITSGQADAVADHLAGEFPVRKFHIHAGLDVAAATIGITEADLVASLRQGQSIAAVAEANGVTAQAVIDALVDEINSRVDEAVAAGDLDSARAAEIKANAVDRVTAFVNGEGRFFAGPRPGFGPGGGEPTDPGA